MRLFYLPLVDIYFEMLMQHKHSFYHSYFIRVLINYFSTVFLTEQLTDPILRRNPNQSIIICCFFFVYCQQSYFLFTTTISEPSVSFVDMYPCTYIYSKKRIKLVKLMHDNNENKLFHKYFLIAPIGNAITVINIVNCANI